MEKDIGVIRRKLNDVVEDKAILEELVAINMLDFVDQTTSSCSGHVDCYGLITHSPMLTVRYNSADQDVQDFHNELADLSVDIEGRKYFFRPTFAGVEYFIGTSFGIHPQKDPLIGPKVEGVTKDNLEICYLFIVPQSYNFENPAKRSVKIIEDFWYEISGFLANFSKPGIYTRREFKRSYGEDGTVESAFRKGTASIGLFG